MNPEEARKHIILAADVESEEALRQLLTRVGNRVGKIKLGLELICAIGGPRAIEMVRELCPGVEIMFDGKFKDIPTTMGRAAAALAEHNPWSFTMHASASIDGMKAAVDNKGDMLALAVTVLTTMSDGDTRDCYGGNVRTMVDNFAHMAVHAGADGIVCSARDLPILAKYPQMTDKRKVIPGIRPTWADANDQKRTMTPGEAMRLGGPNTYLVIGRPITADHPENPGGPEANVQRIIKEIVEATS